MKEKAKWKWTELEGKICEAIDELDQDDEQHKNSKTRENTEEETIRHKKAFGKIIQTVKDDTGTTELLEICRHILEGIDGRTMVLESRFSDNPRECHDRLRAAIAKSTGN